MSEKHIRVLTSAILAAAALAFVGCSMVLNYTSWRAQGGPGLIGQIFGIISIGSDLGKAVVPILIASTWANREWFGFTVATSALLLCLAFSLSGALGIAHTSRNEPIGGREATSLRYAAAEKALRGVEARIASNGISRPAAVIEQLIEHSKQDRRWVASNRCTASVNESMRTFCRSVAILRTELNSSIAADELQARAKALQEEMSTLLASGVRAKSDGQAEIIAWLLNSPVPAVQTSLALLVTLVVEFGAAFLPFLATLPLRSDPGTDAEEVPVAQLREFQDRKPQRIVRVGGRLMIDKAE